MSGGETASGGSSKHKKSGKKSLRAAQGAALPPDRSLIVRYPNGCCVQVELGGLPPAWHLITFRIGKTGPAFASLMRHPPTSPDWNVGLGDSKALREDTIVLASLWPLREQSTEAESGVEEDPLNANASPGVGGALMFNHLRSEPSSQGP